MYPSLKIKNFDVPQPQDQEFRCTPTSRSKISMYPMLKIRNFDVAAGKGYIDFWHFDVAAGHRYIDFAGIKDLDSEPLSLPKRHKENIFWMSTQTGLDRVHWFYFFSFWDQCIPGAGLHWELHSVGFGNWYQILMSVFISISKSSVRERSMYPWGWATLISKRNFEKISM